MPSTDTRVVQMQFDNKDFEKDIAVSQKSLEKFKEELDFDEQEDNLRSFGEATKRINFDSMAENLQKLADKFTGLGTASEYVLSQIRRGIESTVNKISSFVDSMTTQQISAGKTKYEELNKSVQTIKAATGKTEEEVYSVMKRLNEYTDQTSYNFTDMANNIGKFTSVGISLESAERQMEGIANWAARSGAGISEASRAMYNLSQAMGVGSLKLMDWKSIENAGMATKEFKQQMIEAGIAAGTLEVKIGKNGERVVKTAKSLGKQMEVNYTNLSQTLSKGWANTQVIGKTLEGYYYEDLYWEGDKIGGALIETQKEQREKLREALKDDKIGYDQWQEIGLDESDATLQKAINAAVEQKKLTKEINEDGYTVYKAIDKNGKKTEVTLNSLKDLLDTVGVDASLADTLFGLDHDAIMDMADDQKEAMRKALGDDDIILKKDWVEGLTEAGMATDELKQAAIDAAVANGNLEKTVDKAGKVTYKTAKKYGKQIEVTMDNFEDSLKMKWFDADVADKVGDINNLGKESYAAAQKCKSLTDVFDAWRDQLSTGWMQSWTHVFGELTEAMDLFSTICNKVGEAFDSLLSERNKILSIWGANAGRTNLWSMLIGEYRDGEDVMYEGAYGFLDVLLDIGNLLHDGFWNMIKSAIPEDLINDLLGQGFFDDILPEGFEGDFEELWNTEGFKEGFLAYKIDSFIRKIKEFVQGIKDFFDAVPEGGTKSRFQMIQDTVTAIFSTALLIWNILTSIGDFISGLIGKFQPSIDAIISLLGRLGLVVTDVSGDVSKGDGLTDFFNGLLEAITPLADAINYIVETISEMIAGFVEGGVESGSFGNALKTVGEIFTKLVGIVSRVAAPIINFVMDLISIISDLFNGGFTEENLSAIGEKLEESFNKLFNGILGIFGEGVGEKIQNFFAYIFGFAEDGITEGAEDGKKTIVGTIKTWLKKLVDAIKEIFDGFKNQDGDVTVFGMVSGFIKEFFGLGIFDQTISKIGKILQGANIYQLIGLFGKLFLLFKLIQMVSRAGGIFKSIKGFFSGFGDSISEGLKSLRDNGGVKIESFGKKFLNIAKGIALLAASVAILGSLKIETLAKGVGTVAVIMLLIVGFMAVMNQVTKKMDTKQMITIVASIGMVGLAIGVMAISIGLLMLALIPISKLNIQQVANMLTTLLGVVLILALFLKYVSSDISGIKGKDIIGFAAIALSVGILVLSLLPLANIRLEGIVRMMIGLGLILGELILFAKLMGKATLKDKGLWGLIGLAAGIGILILSLQSVANMKLEEIVTMMTVLGLILLELALFASAIGGESSTFKKKGLFSLIGLALSIVVLLEALKPLANFEIGGLLKMGVSLAAILFMLSKFSKSVGEIKLLSMVGIIALAGGIWLLMEALKPMASFEWEDLAKMGVSLLGVVLMLGLFVNLAKDIDIHKGIGAAIAMVGLAGVVALFGVALNSAKDTSWDQILAMCGGLVLVMLAYAIVVEIINNNENAVLKGTHVLIAMVGLAAVLLIFSVALNEIKNVKTEKILAFSIGLAVLIAAVGLALKLTNGMTIGAAIKGILIIAAAVAAMMLVLSALLPIVTGSIASSLQTMSSKLTLVADMLATFMGRMSQFTTADIEEAKEKFKKLVELLASLQDVSGYAAAVNAFALCLMDLGAGIALFQYMVADIPDPEQSTALKLVRKLLDMKDEISAFDPGDFAEKVAVMGAGLYLFDDLSSDVTEEEPMAIKLTSKILGMKDQLSGFSTGSFSDEITRLGSGLFLFTASTAFISTDNPMALKLLGNILDTKDKIDNFLSINVDDLSGKLATLGGALSIYASGAKEAGGLEEGEVPDVTQAVSLLQAIAQSFTGEEGEVVIPEIPQTEEDIGLFGAKLAALAEAIKKFAEASDGLNDAKTILALKVLGFLDRLRTKLTTDNLAKVKIFSESSISEYTISTFSNDIVALATGLTAFADAANSFDEGKTGLALKTLEFLKSLQADLTTDNLKAVNAFKDAGVSTYTLTTFSTDITTLAGGLSTFSRKTRNMGDLTTAKNALRFLLWLKQNLTSDAIKATLVFGNTGVNADTLKQFALDITELGNALADFANNVNFEEDKTKNFNAALDALDFLSKMAARLPVVGGLKGWFEGNVETLGTLSSDIVLLGSGMKEFSDALAGGGNKELVFDTTLVTNALGALKTFAELAVMMGNQSDESVYSNFVWMTRLSTAFAAMTEPMYIDASADENTLSFVDNLVAFMTDLNSKLEKVGGISDTSNLEAFKLTLEGLRELSEIDQTMDFEPVGMQIAAGVANGILNDESNETIVTAAQEMIRRIKAAAEKEAIINSPSRLFADSIGRFLSLGVAQGINDNTDDPAKAAENLVDETTGGALGALAQLSQLLTEGIDTNPTITPVIDLTKAREGMTALNGMFGGGFGMGMGINPAAAAQYAGVSMPRSDETVQNGTDLSGVMESISNMSSQISTLGENISKMKLYLDGKTLVGGLTNGIDANIGRKGFYAQRRN